MWVEYNVALGVLWLTYCFADGMVLLTLFWNELQFLIDLLFIDYKLKLNLNKTFNIKKVFLIFLFWE